MVAFEAGVELENHPLIINIWLREFFGRQNWRRAKISGAAAIVSVPFRSDCQ